MVVPFPPGGVADVTGRPTAIALEKVFKQPVSISNRPGAGGAVGNAVVANAKPDGYTLLMALSSITVIPEADKLFNRKPAYTLDQLAPIALVVVALIGIVAWFVVGDVELYWVVTTRPPTKDEIEAMEFGWKVVKHVKSNAIVYAAKDRTLGIGAGQMSRVDSSRIAVWKAQEAGLSLKGSAVCSDAFFPFPDGLIAAAEAGATCAIQPGGSVRDEEVIKAANERGLAMVFTGFRHFRH
jgi:hypothetical protein